MLLLFLCVQNWLFMTRFFILATTNLLKQFFKAFFIFLMLFFVILDVWLQSTLKSIKHQTFQTTIGVKLVLFNALKVWNIRNLIQLNFQMIAVKSPRYVCDYFCNFSTFGKIPRWVYWLFFFKCHDDFDGINKRL